MYTSIKKYAPTVGASAVVIAAIASAAVVELPASLPASVATGDTVRASHFNDILTSLRTLDDRTDGDAPVDDVDIVNKGYLDGEIASLNTAISNAGDDLGDHTATQDINANGNKITGLAAPTANTDATTKEYVDNAVAAAGGGDPGAGAPDVSSTTGVGEIWQFDYGFRSFAFIEYGSCSSLGSNWKGSTGFNPSIIDHVPLQGSNKNQPAVCIGNNGFRGGPSGWNVDSSLEGFCTSIFSWTSPNEGFITLCEYAP